MALRFFTLTLFLFLTLDPDVAPSSLFLCFRSFLQRRRGSFPFPSFLRGKKAKDTTSDVDDDYWWWLVSKGTTATFIIVGLFALLVCVAVSLHLYSGAAKPPKVWRL
ncbi:hypothetical protein RJT34_23915 [Clitoria ternatea]|uniref:Transmembrane protein n=1 Tax=Clitoria ternatea TaxID=43366 RepID=A0AAN9IL56_CLITE